MKTAKIYAGRTIDINNFRDIRNVAVSLKVSEEQLKTAISAVGPILENVRKHLSAYHNPILHRPKRGMRQ
ncbi:MAG: DUF3606 domain-containing protein [Flavobacterium sp.]|nr:DUF3606 domain-containing protein [Flavobacterium sp.]